jgi:hypothetical protein
VNRRLLLLDFALILFGAGLIWLLHDRYLTARAHEAAVLGKKVPPKAVLAPPSPPLVRPAQPAEYADVAQKTLFSKDRNPNVVVEVPKPPPEIPMPALPIYHGQMAIGEPIAILSLPKQAAIQKGYHAGDTVGDFKLIAFDREKIELEWNGKKVERKPEDLAPKEPLPVAAAAPSPVAAQAAAAQRTAAPAGTAADASGAAPAVTSLGSSSEAASSASSASAPPSGMGAEIGPGVRACLPGDTSPAGTVLSGYQKRMIPSMFGSVCRWEQAK